MSLPVYSPIPPYSKCLYRPEDWRNVRTLKNLPRVDLRDYWTFPLAWFHDIIGIDNLWSGQLDMIDAIRVNREVGLASCHGVGKTYVVAGLALCWLMTHRPSKVIVSSPTLRQAKSQFWSEFLKMYDNAKVDFGPRPLETEVRCDRDWYAQIVATVKAKSFSGIHSANLFMVFDEGSGVPDDVWIERLGAMTGESVRFISMDNPGVPSDLFGKFYCNLPEAARVKFSAFDYLKWVEQGNTPIPGCVTREWLEMMRPFEGTPVWQSKVLGEFSDEDEDLMAVPYRWLRACVRTPDSMANALQPDPAHWDKSIGVDVARYGSDETVFAPRYGQVLGDLHAYRKRGLMETVGHLSELADKMVRESVLAGRMSDANAGANLTHGLENIDGRTLPLNIDAVGMGSGVVDRLRELGYNAREVNGGARPIEAQRYSTFNAELYWNVRMLAEQTWQAVKQNRPTGMVLSIPNDLILVGQLTSRRYSVRSDKVVDLEHKDALRARGGKSPDRGDAAVFAFHRSGQVRITQTKAHADEKAYSSPGSRREEGSHDKWKTEDKPEED
jgi:hypothetical protein